MAFNPAPSPESLVQFRINPFIVIFPSICIVFLWIFYIKLIRQQCCSYRSDHPSRSNYDDGAIHLHSLGLEFSKIQSLPITQFTKDNQASSPGMNECAVCLGEFHEGEWLKHLPNCRHVFHVTCIDAWFRSHTNCPLCRSHVYDTTTPPGCSVPMDSIEETTEQRQF